MELFLFFCVQLNRGCGCMKKYLFLSVLILASLVLLAGCGNLGSISSAARGRNNIMAADWEPTTFEIVNNIDGVTMAVKEGTASATGLTVTLKNTSSSEYIYSEYFWLEKKIGEKWYQVPVAFDGDYAFDDIGYILAPESSSEWTVDWEWLYGSLGAGQYRIVKDVLVSKDSGKYDTYYLAAEFVIQ